MTSPRTNPDTYRQPARALVAGALALLLPGLVVLAAPADAAEEPPAGTGWIRAGHLAPGTEKADVELTPFEGGDTQTLRGVDYGDVTSFQRVPTGLYTVAVVPSGGDSAAQAMVTENVRVDEGTSSTVIATGDEGDVRASVLTDDLSAPPAGQARVRLVAATGGEETLDAAVVGGPALAEGVASGTATGYATVDAATWQVEVAAGAGTETTSRVPVEAGGVYTLLATDDPDGGVELQAVLDSSGSSSMPTGGVDTGAGGLAGAPSGSGPAAMVAVASLVALGVGLVAVRRGRAPGSRGTPGTTR